MLDEMINLYLGASEGEFVRPIIIKYSVSILYLCKEYVKDIRLEYKGKLRGLLLRNEFLRLSVKGR